MIRTVGGLLILVGGVWFLQGVGVLPGSFMTGSPFWAVMGAVLTLAGLVFFAVERIRRDRKRASSPEPPPSPKTGANEG